MPCQTLRRQRELENLSRDKAITSYKSQFDKSLMQSVRASVLRRLAAIESLRDLDEHIVHEVVDSPATYADMYNLAAGSPFGLSHGMGQLSLTRPGPAFFASQNAIAVGSSARPGNGVPLVLVGAKTASSSAIQKIRALS